MTFWVVKVVRVVKGVKVKCLVGIIYLLVFGFFTFHLTCIHKTNVPADLHELLSAAKNLPE